MNISLRQMQERLHELEKEAKSAAWPLRGILLADIAQVRGAIALVQQQLRGFNPAA